jgi:predicted anti-sigma-YlaC factor YlaD
MAMNEHDKIRELLALAAAGALTAAEEKRVAEHVQSCITCLNELDAWQPIVTGLRQLPTPQPSSRLAEATLARVEAKLAEQAEHDWTRRVIILVVALAWLMTIVSWVALHFVSGRFGSSLGPQFAWISFAAFTALAWVAGGVAAVMLGARQRGERGVA